MRRFKKPGSPAVKKKARSRSALAGLRDAIRRRAMTTATAGNLAGPAGDKEKDKMEKRRALGRGLASLLPGPRVVAPPPAATAPPAAPAGIAHPGMPAISAPVAPSAPMTSPVAAGALGSQIDSSMRSTASAPNNAAGDAKPF